jgi:hypothetical protein
MNNKKIGIAILTSPLIFTVNAQDINLPNKDIITKDISSQAIKKIDRIGNKHQDKAKAFVELGEPWIEWSQEQKDIRKDRIKHAYPDKVNTIDTYKKILPNKGVTLQKENIKIIKP